MPSITEFQEAAVGLSEKTIGLIKETIGTFMNNEGLRDSGRAQQRKATEKLEAFGHELKADKHRAEALAKDKEQGLHQDPSDRSDSGDLGKSGPRAGISATGEKVKGAVKQAVGAVTGNDDLRREGDVQQDKADSQARAAKEEAKAEASRAKARVAETEEKAAKN